MGALSCVQSRHFRHFGKFDFATSESPQQFRESAGAVMHNSAPPHRGLSLELNDVLDNWPKLSPVGGHARRIIGGIRSTTTQVKSLTFDWRAAIISSAL